MSNFNIEKAPIAALERGERRRYHSISSDNSMSFTYRNDAIVFNLVEQVGERKKFKWSLCTKNDSEEEPLISVKGSHLLEIEWKAGGKKCRQSFSRCTSVDVRSSPGTHELSISSLGEIGYFLFVTADFDGLGTAELEIAIPKSGHLLASRAKLKSISDHINLSWIRFLGFEVDFPDESGLEKPFRCQHVLSVLMRKRLWATFLLGCLGVWIFFLISTSVRSQSTKIALGVFGAAIGLVVFHLLQAWWYTGPRSFLYNGWNAWSFTGALKQGQKLQKWSMPNVCVKAFHQGSECTRGFNQKKLHIASEMFGVLAETAKRRAVVAGFLSQREQFGAIGLDRAFRSLSFNCACDNLVVKADQEIQTDWALLHLLPTLPDEPLEVYFEAAARTTGALDGRGVQVPVGWCSWYDFFDKVTESDLVENLKNLEQISEELPLSLFQIDDGYQEAWGDWTTLDSAKFSPSISNLVTNINKSGFTPGIWLAPYSADKDSKIAEQKPEWIIRKTKGGKPSNSANCGKWFYGLDVTDPQVIEHVDNIMRTVTKDWGFRYVKLDFLYSAVLKGFQTGKRITRAQAMQVAFQTIRNAIGDEVFFLGCGTPIGSALGWVNANRVSSDAGLSWDPELPLPPQDKWNLPSAKNMMRSTIVRMPMHGRWWINDPDCLLLRNTTHFSITELLSIATIKALSGGSLLLSDDMQSVSKGRLRIAKQLLPISNLAATPLDLLDRETPEELRLNLSNPSGNWILLALCNWERFPRTKNMHFWHLKPLFEHVDPGYDKITLFIFDFWNTSLVTKQVTSEDFKNPHYNDNANVVGSFKLDKHGSKLFSVRVLLDPQLPLYLGSDIHFSCGLEITLLNFVSSSSSHSCNGHCLVVKFDVGRKVGEGWVWLYLPQSQDVPLSTSGCSIGKPVPVSSECVWKVPVSLEKQFESFDGNTLKIDWTAPFDK